MVKGDEGGERVKGEVKVGKRLSVQWQQYTRQTRGNSELGGLFGKNEKEMKG